MNKILKRVISLVLLIGWLVIIYLFSNMNGSASSLLSQSFLNILISNVLNNTSYYEIIHFIFRKMAHITEYFILSLLAYNYFRYYIKDKKTLYISTFMFNLICSIFDELHQLLVLDRSGKFYDILIDNAASAIFLIIIIKINNVAKRKSD